MSKIIFALIIIEFIIIGILKIRSIYYNKKIENLKKMQSQMLTEKKLLNPDVSYERYKIISQKSSIPNRPVRTNGDFADFLISHITTNSEILENNIMTIDYEDFYE
ncbi:hypothetical protein MR857_09205 [bacterium]|uniref:hypothetical protein n=1 Tax=Lachnospiraceae TaxID=186803 RepID=UPI003D067A52|nr:hypothetical protein [bacterium]